ncbi:hypothetical protein A4A49_40970 [Nicotiana attenuata]|uniref:Uncharacterized protein n=2 Tax=Nicotiana attenuata TaxID=49451 RepID=A0A1J6JV44_NICAT|nr:hypothetical protein A4A49_40970 [Nicotiana attenuata]
MAALSSSKSYHIRSISLLGRSHPTTQRVEEELNKLKTLDTTVSPAAETICSALFGLEKLHKCMDDLLYLPQTLQSLSKHQNGKWIEDLLEKSVRIIDVCGTARDLVSQSKESVRDLQSALRRRKGDASAEASISRFTSVSKKIKKEAKMSIVALKQMDHDTEISSILLDADQQTTAIFRALREVNAMCISIFQMLLLSLCVPIVKPKPSKWSKISRLVHKGRIACEDQEEIIETRLETFDAQLESFENGLEGIFRCLIRSRSSLLKIFSC